MQNTTILYMYSDYICPWCYYCINDLKRLEEETGIQVRRKSFQILPAIPVEGISMEEYDAMRGNSPATRDRNNKIIDSMSKETGLKWVPRKRMCQSRYAHMLGKHLAEHFDLFEEYSRVVFNLEYGQGQDIAKIDTLMKVLDTLGLKNKVDLGIVLKNKVYLDMIEKDMAEANRLRITGAPAFMLNGRVFPGFHTYNELKQFVAQ